MKVFEHFENLLMLTGQIALQEAKAKYSDTVMYVNGKLYSISGIETDTLHVSNDDMHNSLTGDEIKSIRPFIPDSGVYMIEGSPHILWRLPKRQWKKSFNWNFYESNRTTNVFSIDEQNRCEIYRVKDCIYYWDKAIGKYMPKSNRFECTNSVFQFEFERFVRGNNGLNC